jgi:hypothetical protein
MAAIGAWFLRNLSEAGKQIILSLGTSSPPVSLDPGHPDKGLEELARMYPDTGLPFHGKGPYSRRILNSSAPNCSSG